MISLSQRLLPVLQLTRMALVFTALADSACALLLAAQKQGDWRSLDVGSCVLVAIMSIGLYGFGMSLNDIIDRRRDRQIAAHRPLPSGRIGVLTAHIICTLLGLSAVGAGAIYAQMPGRILSLPLVVFTGLLITFYDFAGKYLVALGLLTLGVIRFFHATIAAPSLPLLWHPLFLLNHVAILSTIGYAWEQKRPPLRRRHWWSVLGGLAGIDALAIFLVWWHRAGGQTNPAVSFRQAMWVNPGLYYPIAAAAVFVLLACYIRLRRHNLREAGQTLVLTGLLWLIVYDAAFVAGYCGLGPGLVVLMLLPIAYLAVQIMRWWSKLILLSQRPQFKRIET